MALAMAMAMAMALAMALAMAMALALANLYFILIMKRRLIMLTKYFVNGEEWYRADEVDKELQALSGTELAKENIRLRLELEEKREDTKAGEDMIVELRAKIKQFTLCYEVQFELLKKKLNYMSCDGALSPAYGDLLVGQKKGELMMLNKCKKLIEETYFTINEWMDTKKIIRVDNIKDIDLTRVELR